MRKRNIHRYVLAAALCGTMCFGTWRGISAFFTDMDTKVNTITVGSIKTELEEPKWDEIPEEKKKDITPKQTLEKDPKVTNTGKNDAFIFTEVQIPMKKIVCTDEEGKKLPEKETKLFCYETESGWTQIKEEIVEREQSKYQKYIYVYGTEKECTPLKSGESTPPLFQSIEFVNAVEGQIDNEKLEIPVKTYAIQAENAGKTAVPEEVFSIYMKQNKTE